MSKLILVFPLVMPFFFFFFVRSKFPAWMLKSAIVYYCGELIEFVRFRRSFFFFFFGYAYEDFSLIQYLLFYLEHGDKTISPRKIWPTFSTVRLKLRLR